MKKFLSLVLTIALVGTMIVSAFADTVIGKAGDANMDGETNIVDVALMRAHIIGSATLEGDAFSCADINDDAVVDIIDVAMVRNAIVNLTDLGDKVVPSEDPDTSDTDSDVVSDSDVATDTDATTDTDAVTDTDVVTDTDTDTGIDVPIGKTYRLEAEDSENVFSSATTYSGVGEDNYKPDFAGESSGDGYAQLQQEGKVTIKFTPEYRGIYDFAMSAYSTGKVIKVEIPDADYSNEFTIDDYKTLDNSWDNVTDAGIKLEAKTYDIVLSCTSEVYNVCVDYIEFTLVEYVPNVEPDTDTDTATDTDIPVETDTDSAVDTDTAVDTDKPVDTDRPDVSGDIPSGVIGDFTKDWFTSAEGDDVPSTVSSVEELSNGGLRVNIDLQAETYTYLTNFPSGLDLTDYSTLSLVVTNPNANSIQIQPIFKVGTAWTWTEYDQYKEIPANTTTVLTFDMSGCATRNNVMAVIFRIQSGSVKFAGNVDILSMGYDLPANAYANEIAEINRPKSADAFTWAYPESDWTAKTTGTSVENGVITVNFSGITTTGAAGVQTETKPGLGTGLDCSDYSTLTCTITNNSADDIHITLVLKTGGGWLWQENGGVVVGSDENERIIAAGETVDVTYQLKGSTWKSADSGWAYSGTLSGAEDVRAIAFKIYTGDHETATGSVEISNFAFNF